MVNWRVAVFSVASVSLLLATTWMVTEPVSRQVCARPAISPTVLPSLAHWPQTVAVLRLGNRIYTAIGWTFYISTVKWNSQIIDYTFVGLRNWTRLFNDNRFYTDLRNLVYYAIGFMTQCILFGFIIASLLDQKIKGEAIFRANTSGKSDEIRMMPSPCAARSLII